MAYDILGRGKRSKSTFDRIITEMYERTGNVEPSFSSKLVATLNTDMPVWDKYVLRNLNKKLIGTCDKARIMNAISIYDDIIEWYNDFLSTEEAQLWIKHFDVALSEYIHLAATKKIDLILWSMRE